MWEALPISVGYVKAEVPNVVPVGTIMSTNTFPDFHQVFLESGQAHRELLLSGASH